MSKPWNKIIVHVDMDAFFASIEQRDHPELRGKPVAITNGEQGSCVITRSYEARAFGVKTGMSLRDAKTLCPGLVRCVANHPAYATASRAIMKVLQNVTPDIEVFSVDEAFLDLTHCKTLYRSPKQVAELIRRLVWQVAHVTCSIGISGDKTTAKYASKLHKPNAITIIPPWKSKVILAPVPVNQICGIGKGIERFLAQYGVYVCGDMQKIPISVLGQRFGNLGRRLWKMCQGEDPDPVNGHVGDPKSMGHGKVMPPNTKDKQRILYFLHHMADKLARRLRQHELEAKTFMVGVRLQTGWLTTKCKTTYPTQDGQLIFAIAKRLIETRWHGEGVFQCQITATDPQPASLQADLFADNKQGHDKKMNQVYDDIIKKFGNGSITHATHLQPLTIDEPISPAWRPDGHRSTRKD